jgi:hypothetical protein
MWGWYGSLVRIMRVHGDMRYDVYGWNDVACVYIENDFPEQ